MAQTDTNKTAAKPTESKATADTKTATTAPPAADTSDRGDVGVVTIRKSTREITNVRTRTSTDPIHVAVKDATKGEWYDIEVDDDAAKIERVARKLRAAAQKYDVGMNIHPDHVPAEDGSGNKIAGKVIVSFRTGDRDKRARTDANAPKVSPALNPNNTPDETKAAVNADIENAVKAGAKS